MKRAVLALALCAAPTLAAAEPLRLRGQALAAAEAPVGLLSLEADAELVPWLYAEAMLWLGAGESDGPGADGASGGEADALIAQLEARSADGRRAARLGRLIAQVGALRPLHFDGAAARVALPARLLVEAFAGVPVAAASLESRSFDWLAGGRVARRLGDFGSVGVAYLHQRDRGAMATEELALDAGLALGEHAEAASRLALDLIRFGVAEAQLSAALRRGRWRGELALTQRSPSHLLPATSLFSVLGDGGAQRAAALLHVWAAPRLEVTGEAGALRVDGELEAELVARARLWLGDRRAARLRQRHAALEQRGQRREVGSLGLELRRTGADGGGWTGGRLAARLPLSEELVASSELELVLPDESARGRLWPWALAALAYKCAPWEAAVAVEASASPELSSRLDVLARVARSWGAP